MEAYLDNSATTKPLPSVVEIMTKVLTEDYGNPSSLHTKGIEAEKYIKNARSIIAKTLRAKDKEIIFTSGGTEANNLAIRGTAEALKRQGNHIISTPMEHPSAGNPVEALKAAGYEVDYLSVDETGRVSEEEVKKLLREDTILVSVMHVNNEIGTVQPVEEIGRVIRETAEINGWKKPYFHVDGIQSYAKIPVYPKEAGIDLYTASGHKFHGLKGVGFLYAAEGTRLIAQNMGGGQESGMRSGTENVPGIAGMGVAAEEAFKDLNGNEEALRRSRDLFLSKVSALPDVKINGAAGQTGAAGENAAPHIVSLTVKGVRSEVLLHSLEDKGIYVSAGSACSSHKRSVSPTLSSIGLSREDAESTVRFSFSRFTGEDEICYTLEVMEELLPMLRRFTRR